MLDILSRWSLAGPPGSRSFLLTTPYSVQFPEGIPPSMYCLMLRLSTPSAVCGSVVGISPLVMADPRQLNLLIGDEIARLELEARH